MKPIFTTILSTPLGPLSLTVTETTVTELSFDPVDSPADAAVAPELLSIARKQLEEYFSGTRREFDLPLEQSGTAFQQRVWRELCAIPFGTTISYQELADRVGNPAAVRAVGMANGRNNLVILVPCHRVIGSDGSLTGFTSGLERKRWLLEHEGVGVRGSLWEREELRPALERPAM